MTDRPTDEQLVVNQQSALERHVLLFAPTMGYWKGIYQIPQSKTDVKVDGKTVNSESVTTPRAKLITDTYPCDRQGVPWKKRLQKLESGKNQIIDSMSLPFPIHGIRIIAKSKGNEFFTKLFGETIGSLKRRIKYHRDRGEDLPADRLQARLDQEQQGKELPNDTPLFDPSRGENQSVAFQLRQLAVEFNDQWEDIKAQIKKNNVTYDLVSSKLPVSPYSKFYLDCVPIEIAGGRNPEHVNEMDLAEHADIVRTAVQRHTEQAIETLIQGPRAELAEALGALKDLINRDGRVTQKSFNPVRNAIAKIRMFDFVANKQLLEEMSNLDRLLGNTVPTSLDSVSAANNGFTAALDRYMNEVEDADQAARDLEEFGREHRAIDI